MRSLPLLLLTLSLLFMVACGKRHTLAVIDRNCTGTYLTVQQRVYRVCNDEKVAAFENGEVVDVHFRISHDCEKFDDPICLMAFDYDGVVEILSVN